MREALDKGTRSRLKGEPRVTEIDDAGTIAVQQIEEICKSNKAAMDERDVALKEVVETVAWAVGSFKSHGERHKTNLTRLADGFDSLSRVEDVGELRRRLREDVASLRATVEQMRQESEESVRRLETQVSAFQSRVEQARKETDVDRLTGLGSRREAERIQPAGGEAGMEWSAWCCSILRDSARSTRRTEPCSEISCCARSPTPCASGFREKASCSAGARTSFWRSRKDRRRPGLTRPAEFANRLRLPAM